MAETTTVFLSSTRQDLAAYRAAVDATLREAGLLPIGMESFGAREDLPLDVCLKEVRGADLFVGIYAWRYGFVPAGESASITELEYREACRLKKPCFCFLVDEAQAWPEEGRELERAAELAAFKARLRAERVVTTFTTPDDLARHVVSALLRVERQRRELSGAERRDLQTLLDRVASFWIEKRLAESTLGGGLIEISREERDDAVAQPFEGELRAAPTPVGLPDQPILELFESRGRELLILGGPGAGKTTTLLTLARGLVDLARRDASQPIPVVLKLSAWDRAARSLDDWLAGEVAKRFSFDRTTVAAWIAGRHLLPLLDGLDEAEPERRAACVEAINGYVAAHPGCGIAVTCRTAVNAELTPRLKLQAAVALRPLRREQIEGYLTAHGAEAGALESALRDDPAWEDLAQSPLLLGMMDRVVRQAGAAALGAAPGASPAERRRLLFATFVEEMLKRPRGEGAAARGEPPEPTVRRLSWLARQMERQACDPFQVEDLEPGWLATPGQLWGYALASRALVGLLLVLPLALFDAPGLLGPFGLLGGVLAGLADGARLRRSLTPAGPGGGGRRAVLLGGGVLLLFLLCAALWRTATHPEGIVWRADLVDGLTYGALWGLLFGLLFGFHRGRRDGLGDTRVGEAWVWSGWSGRGALRGGGVGIALALGFWGRSVLDDVLRGERGIFGATFWLFFSLVFGIAGSLLGAFLAGFGPPGESPQSRRSRTLWRALRNLRAIAFRGLLGLCLVLWIGYAVYLLSGGAQNLALPDLVRKQLLLVPVVPTTLALWLFLWAGGIDLVQHLTLRLLLAAAGTMPLRWKRFLDSAADRALLRQEGPSYTFYHRLLRDYFVGLPETTLTGLRPEGP